MLNSDSRNRSAVGRISREDGDARLRPFNRPPTTRISVRSPCIGPYTPTSQQQKRAPFPLVGKGWGRGCHTRRLPAKYPPPSPSPTRGEGTKDSFALENSSSLLVARLQVALAVIAALWTPRRTVATGLGFIACARFVAAGALHQHATALAVGDQAVLAGRLERLFRCLRIGVFIGGFCLALHRTGKIRARQHRNLLAELLAQHAGFYLLALAFGHVPPIKRR